MLDIGQSAEFSKTICEADIINFAGICGDFNPIHINKVYAEKSVFGNRIVHGMLVGSFISTVLGMYLPGLGTIYLGQTLNFKKPVCIGDTVTAKVTVSEIQNVDKGIYKLKTVVTNQNDEIVVDGEAIVKYKEMEN